MIAVAVAMAVLPDTRAQFFMSLLTVLALVVACEARAAWAPRSGVTGGTSR